jgi:mono/diheme cytochrome c family protein
VKGVDPLTGREASWQGLDLAEVVQRAKAERADTVVIRSADGQAVPITMNALFQYRPVLADHADGEALAASRLAWPNVENPGLTRDPRHLGWWVSRPVAVELVIWPVAFGRALATPPGSPEGVRPGAGLFVQRCVACHQIRKAGGTAGPDLSLWASQGTQEALAARLQRHPGRFPEDLEQDFLPPLWAYLNAMSKAPPLPDLPPPAAKDRKRKGTGRLESEPDVDDEPEARPRKP